MLSPRWTLPLLLLLTLSSYLSLVHAAFVWDDLWLFVTHPTFPRETLLELIQRPLWYGVIGPGEMPYYRPVLLASVWLDRELFGFNPMGWHLHSLLWHLLGVALLYRLLRRLLPGEASSPLEGRLPALVGALVFALHPVQTEVVAWIAARNDSIAHVMVMAMLLSLLPERGMPSVARSSAAGIFYGLALLSKESALLTPVVALLLLLNRSIELSGQLSAMRMPSWARLRVLVVPALALLGGLVTVWVLRAQRLPSTESLLTVSLLEALVGRLPTILGTFGGLIVWPWPLAVGRDLRDVSLELTWVEVLGWFFLLALWVLPYLQPERGRRRLAWLGVLAFACTLLPAMLGVLTTQLLAERYLYLPLAFLGLSVAALVPVRRQVLFVLLLLGGSWLSVISVRLPDWANDYELFRADAMRMPGCGTHLRYTRVLMGLGRAQEALDLLEQRTYAEPTCPAAGLTVALAGLALGRPELGERVLAAEPTFLKAVDAEQAGVVAFVLAALRRDAEARLMARAVAAQRRGTFAEVVLLAERLRLFPDVSITSREADPDAAERARVAGRAQLLRDVPQAYYVVLWTARLLEMRGEVEERAKLERLGYPLEKVPGLLLW
ncbi:MAG: glycosyltransferase family 39 protein [Myxococcota bacterium]